MKTKVSRTWINPVSYLAVSVLLAGGIASGAAAQAQGPIGGPPAGAGPMSGPPPGFPEGGPPPGGPPGPPGAPLTPAQQLVLALPPPAMIEGLTGPPPKMFFPPLPEGAEMPSADPRDLQGTWSHNQPLEFRMLRDMYGNVAPYTMEGARVFARRVQSLQSGTPFINASTSCRPVGPQWQMDLNFPFQIFQTEDWVEFVFLEYHGRWQIVLSPAAAPAPQAREYMGRSVGHWDGGTLVVETSGFKQALWLDVDGTPLSAEGKLVHRIRKVNNSDRQPFLEVVTTISDPKYYERPWSVVRTFAWQPSLALFDEYNCELQTGAPGVSADSGLIPEPQD